MKGHEPNCILFRYIQQILDTQKALYPPVPRAKASIVASSQGSGRIIERN